MGAVRRDARRLHWIGSLLRVDHGDGGHVDDVLHVGAALEHVHRATHADEDRPDRRRPAEVVQQLVGDVARAQVRENQHVRLFLERAERIVALDDLRIERGVGLHLAVDDERRIALPQQRDGARHLLGLGMPHRPEVREREHRDARLDADRARDAARRVARSARAARRWDRC